MTRLTGIAWRTVGAIVERVVARHRDPAVLEGLRRIGIDEIGYRKRHNYVTIVVDHDRRRIEVATIDMSAAFTKATKARLPNATTVFDCFHVQRLMTDAVDAVRCDQVGELKGTEQAKAIKGSRYALLKSPWNLNRSEHQRLAEVQRTNKQLYRAHLLKKTLAQALDYRQPWRAERALADWLQWACRSRLEPVTKAARTIRKHLPGILAYVKLRLTNGVVEGINNRIRMITRRAFGFHSPPPLIAMIFLCCGGITLDPPLPRPT